MKMYKKIIAMLVLAAVGLSLCLTGCGVNINMGNGLSDFSYADAENYSVGAAEFSETVEHIEIDWLAGNVTVASHSSDTVSFSEESLAALTEDTQLHYWLDGTTLHMKFCRSGKWRLDGLEKDLTVLVPEDLPLTSLTVKSMSANIHLDALQAESANIGTSSGNVELTDCAVTDIVQVDTTSGWVDMSLIEPLETFSWGTTSGTLQITAPKVRNFSAGSVSGNSRKRKKDENEYESENLKLEGTCPVCPLFTACRCRRIVYGKLFPGIFSGGAAAGFPFPGGRRYAALFSNR